LLCVRAAATPDLDSELAGYRGTHDGGNEGGDKKHACHGDHPLFPPAQDD
jgi:hypothetical protein